MIKRGNESLILILLTILLWPHVALLPQGLLIDVGYAPAGASGGPAPPLLVDEGFEGTGLPSGWTTEDSSTIYPDYDYTGALVGSQSLLMEAPVSPAPDLSTRVQISTVDDTIDVYFKMSFTALPSATEDRLVTLLSDDGAYEWAIVGLNTDGSMYCIHGGVSSFITDPMSVNVTNHIWITYTRNTGGNSGYLSVSWSTNGTRPLDGRHTELENGVAVGYPGRVRWKRNSNLANWRIDRVLVSEDPIGDNP